MKDPVFYFYYCYWKLIVKKFVLHKLFFPFVSSSWRHLWPFTMTVCLFVVPLSLELKIKSLDIHGRNPTPDTVALITLVRALSLHDACFLSPFLWLPVPLKAQKLSLPGALFYLYRINKTLNCHTSSHWITIHCRDLKYRHFVFLISVFPLLPLVKCYSIRRQIC